ncbi:DUF1488 family protein [Bradyrhizobium sp.]|uniref:DUF1488 family protein n=1 Tax=Bradyrhizobium sp. TaxID=376 RepID=UPI0039E272DF
MRCLRDGRLTLPRRPQASQGQNAIPLTRGHLRRYDAARMAFLFTMMHGEKMVDCEISSTALDDLDGVKGTWPHQREAQFVRLREVVERVASCVFKSTPAAGRIRIFSKHVRNL